MESHKATGHKVTKVNRIMPKRTDIKNSASGSGPIVIGQACESTIRGRRRAGPARRSYEIVLAIRIQQRSDGSEFSDAVYMEPLTPEFVELIIAKERPCAILPTLGGQTALNIAMKLCERGVLEKYHVKMLGANYDVIKRLKIGML